MKKYTIVCFGDSNTWGFDSPNCDRYPEEVRWTGRLQSILGDEYKVIEEGLCGRNIATEDPAEGEKSGMTTLVPVMESQMPFDLFIIMLGTNDTKRKFAYSARDIQGCMEQMLMKALSFIRFKMNDSAKILLVAPAPIHEAIKDSFYGDMFQYERSRELSLALPELFKELADRYQIEFFDAGTVATADPFDGIHLNPDGHEKLACALAKKIVEIKKK